MDNTVNQNDVSRIAQSTVFKGEFTSSNDVRIDGVFDGRIQSNGRLVVGENAIVNGEVVCNNVDFSGRMSQGTFWVKDTLALKAGSSVDGDLRFQRLQVDLDARINGNCRLLGENEFEQVSGVEKAAKAQEEKKAPVKETPKEEEQQ